MTDADDKIRRNVGHNLMWWLGELGWSQGHLAHKSGVSRTTISMIIRSAWAKGEIRGPTLTVAARLAKALGITIDELIRPPEPSWQHKLYGKKRWSLASGYHSATPPSSSPSAADGSPTPHRSPDGASANRQTT